MKNIVIIGGVAGGASCATRLRRLDEKANIVLLERSGYVSFANCGLPYYIGGDIAEEGDLLVQSAEGLRARYNIDVRVRHEAIALHPAERTVDVRDLEKGETYTLPYDELLLSPGARPFVPDIEGVREPGVFTLRNMEDVQAIHAFAREGQKAVVVGGGFIGVEIAENLKQRGLDVTIIEASEQILPPFDPEMAHMLERHLAEKGIAVRTASALTRIERAGDGLLVQHLRGTLEADIVLLAIGVRAEDALAREAGLATVARGGIQVDEYLRTSDPHIYAVGDAVLDENMLTGSKAPLPLAGPANRQGRMAADNMAGGREMFCGVIGTSVVKVCELTGAATGLNEKTLNALGKACEKQYLYANDHAGYYPGAQRMLLKMLYSPNDRCVLGAQAVGPSGVDKRIDVIATAIKLGAKIDDLAQLELCYAPPYGSAKDPVNLLGMAAQDALAGLTRSIHWNDIDKLDRDATFILDVRTKEEFEVGAIAGAHLIPVDELRGRLDEVPRDRPVVIYCAAGARGYLAERILRQNGYEELCNLAGGYELYSGTEGIR